MNLSHILTASALFALASFNTQAEPYEGVNAAVSAKSRSEVNAEAVKAASAPDQNVELGSRGAERFESVADRAVVRAQAIAAANAVDATFVASSKVNSRVVPTMTR